MKEDEKGEKEDRAVGRGGRKRRIGREVGAKKRRREKREDREEEERWGEEERGRERRASACPFLSSARLPPSLLFLVSPI